MLRARLTPGGIFVLETPDFPGIDDVASRRANDKIHPLEHINGFTPATLGSIAERSGFRPIAKPVSHVTVNPVKVAKTELKRTLGFALGSTTQQYFRLN